MPSGFDLAEYDLIALLMSAHHQGLSGRLLIERPGGGCVLHLEQGRVTLAEGDPLHTVLPDGPGLLRYQAARQPRPDAEAELRRGLELGGAGLLEQVHKLSWEGYGRQEWPTLGALVLQEARQGDLTPRVWPDLMRVTAPAQLTPLSLSHDEKDLLRSGVVRPTELYPHELRLMAALWRMGLAEAVRPKPRRGVLRLRLTGSGVLVDLQWLRGWEAQLQRRVTQVQLSARSHPPVVCGVQGQAGLEGRVLAPLLWLSRHRLQPGTPVTVQPPGPEVPRAPEPGATVTESHTVVPR